MNENENAARAAARRLLATSVPNSIREAFKTEYGLDLGAESTYEHLLFARLRQLAQANSEAAALLKRYCIKEE